MWSTLVQLLPSAIGFMFSPAGLIEMILVLLSRRSRTNGIVFLVAILIPTFVIPFLGAAGLNAATSSGSERSTAKGAVLLVIAALLFVMAVKNWRNRHDEGVPAVFGKIENMGPGPVLALSPGVTFVNPKNLLLLLGAGSVAAQSGLSGGELALTIAIFTVTATLPFIGMVGYITLGGDAAQATLGRWKDWLLHNNRLIMAVVLAVLAVVLGVKGVGALG